MRVLELVRPGVVSVEERECPEPGPNELLLKVDACGICGHDVLQYHGALGAPYSEGVVPGHEIAGHIVDCGDAVNAFEVGDRVACVMGARSCGECVHCLKGKDTLCYSRVLYGEDLPGGFAEYVVVEAGSAARIPPGLSAEAASVAGCALGTALHAFEAAGLRRGDRVAVTGGSGGVGLHAIQAAKARGATVVAVTSRKENANLLSKFADVVAIGPEFGDELRERDLEPDIILELTAGVTLQASLRAIRRGGCVAIAGNLTSNPVEVFPAALLYRGIRLVGVKGAGRCHLEEGLRLLASGHVVAQVITFPFPKIEAAFRALDAGQVRGRAVLSTRSGRGPPYDKAAPMIERDGR